MRNVLNITGIILACIIISCNSTSKKNTIILPVKDNAKPKTIQSKCTVTLEEAKVDSQTINTNLVYPQFVVRLHNFCVYESAGDGNSYYLGDSAEVNIKIDRNKVWNLSPKTDTTHLLNFNTDFKTTIEVIPTNKADNFKVSYYSKIYIEGFNDKFKLQLSHPYKQLNDSLNYFFKISESIYDGYNSPVINEVKNELKLKDTLIKYKTNEGKMDKTKLLNYKGKPCRISSPSPVYFKIERFKDKRIMDTRFFTIEPISPEEGE